LAFFQFKRTALQIGEYRRRDDTLVMTATSFEELFNYSSERNANLDGLFGQVMDKHQVRAEMTIHKIEEQLTKNVAGRMYAETIPDLQKEVNEMRKTLQDGMDQCRGGEMRLHRMFGRDRFKRIAKTIVLVREGGQLLRRLAGKGVPSAIIRDAVDEIKQALKECDSVEQWFKEQGHADALKKARVKLGGSNFDVGAATPMPRSQYLPRRHLAMQLGVPLASLVLFRAAV